VYHSARCVLRSVASEWLIQNKACPKSEDATLFGTKSGGKERKKKKSDNLKYLPAKIIA
jgi:hypothetical protein